MYCKNKFLVEVIDAEKKLQISYWEYIFLRQTQEMLGRKRPSQAYACSWIPTRDALLNREIIYMFSSKSFSFVRYQNFHEFNSCLRIFVNKSEI